MEYVVMGKKEQLKISIIEKIIAGKLQQKKALDYLNVSERTLRRWVLSYKQKGIRSFVHGNKGRAPKNRKPLELKYKVTDLLVILREFSILWKKPTLDMTLLAQLRRQGLGSRQICKMMAIPRTTVITAIRRLEKSSGKYVNTTPK